MASSKAVDETSSRVTCSVCLERFSGRQPKLLPCFHTFCSPCLSALAQAKQGDGAEGDACEGAACATITCPTCRKVTPVPSGGIPQFQTNFYIIDDSDDEEDSVQQPASCQLCDGGQPSSHHCSKCGYFCSQCQRIHSKCCSSTQVTTLVLTSSTGTPAPSALNLDRSYQHQVKVIQTALENLEENRKKVSQEKQAIEDGLNACYTKQLHLLAEAKEECLSSLRNAAKTVEDRLQTEVAAAQEARAKLNQLPSPQKNSSATREKNILSDAELKRFAECSRDDRQACLSWLSKPLASSEEFYRSIFGTVVMREEGQDGIFEEKVADDVPESQRLLDGGDKAGATLHNSASDVLRNLELLERKYANATSSLQSQLDALKQKNRQVSYELNTVQQKNVELISEMSSLKDAFKMMAREQTSSKDKASLLCQDVAALQARDAQSQKEFSAFKKEFTADVESRRGTESIAQPELLSLRRSVKKHEEALRTVESKLDNMQIKVAFHALLHSHVRLKSKRVLILKENLFNIGNGYDNSNGYFTAPVSGVYLFLATSSSFDKAKWARLDLVHEGKDMAYLSAQDESCTLHSTFRVAAGERVWLSSPEPLENETCCFQSRWRTSFSGVLIQPDL